MRRVFVCGDCHRWSDLEKFNNENFPIVNDLTKDDVMIVAGDWGAIWWGDEDDDIILKWWEDNPWTTLVVLGNHENYNAIEKLPIVEKFGSKCYQVSKSVFITFKGEVYNIAGKSILTLGGADSIDKHLRIKDVDWWEQESITQKDFNNALNNLERYNYDVDYFITHTGGSEVVKFLGFNPFPSDKYVDFILDSLSPRTHHYCAHYHVDMIANLRSKILYNAIVELT